MLQNAFFYATLDEPANLSSKDAAQTIETFVLKFCLYLFHFTLPQSSIRTFLSLYLDFWAKTVHYWFENFEILVLFFIKFSEAFKFN